MVKACKIETDRYCIHVISYLESTGLTPVQIIDVHLDERIIAHSLRLRDDWFFDIDPILSEYDNESFLVYIKGIVHETLKWIEYWQEI